MGLSAYCLTDRPLRDWLPMRLRQVVPLLAVLVFCGWPAASQAASFAPAVHHRTTDSAQDILRFWTKQRMATAWPVAVPAGHPARQHASAPGPSLGFLFYCDNPISFYEGDDHGKYQWHMPCDMTGGSSGGPWLAQAGGRWYVVSDTSNGDGDDETIPTTFLDGPNLDGVDAKGFYDQAQGATTTGCVVPGVRGLRLAAARAAIVNAHCSLGKVRPTRSVRRRWGRVLSQWPARGMQFATGARIDLVVGRR
jgi:hypothetical protein